MMPPPLSDDVGLTAYALHDHAPRLRAAQARRGWMDAFQDRHAYRCLPLAMANAYGWEVLMPVTVEVEWTGDQSVDGVIIRADKELPGGRPLEHFCLSNFSRGVVTFHTDYIFRTGPGWGLHVGGPPNLWRANAAAMTGIVETDWLPYPFTMNWQMLRPGIATFSEGEPFCHVFPLARHVLTDVVPEVRRVQDDPELEAAMTMFRKDRDRFLREGMPGGWQRHYFLGRHPDGTEAEGHVNKLRLREPDDRRGR